VARALELIERVWRRAAWTRVGAIARNSLLALSLMLSTLCFSTRGNAQSTIKTPGERPSYTVEAEPHVLLGWLPPPGAGQPPGLGLGARATIEVAKDGFLPKLNDSVGIGIGLDWVQYQGRADQTCGRFVNGPNGTRVCTEIGGDLAEVTTFYIPVVMQWNFWLTRKWSVFGEPGILVHIDDKESGVFPIILAAGGRFHIQDRFTLTARIGHPAITFGVSFLL
jgi:hypothetical protein